MTSTGSVEVTFVRHGESTFNVTGQWQGHGDAPLSDRGREQAAAVGARLGIRGYDRVVSSDLTRAFETARATGHKVEPMAVWREIDVGRWEGFTRPEVAERFPEEIAGLMRGDDIKIGGGESWSDLHARVGAALEELLASLKDGQRAAVFAHGGVIASVVSGAMRLRHLRPRPVGRVSNTAVTRLRFYRDGRAELLSFNDASHVMPMPAWAHEMGEQGATLATLVADGDARDQPDLDAPLVRKAFEGVHHVVGRGRVAEGLAEGLAVPLRAPLDAPVGKQLELAPQRVALVLPARELAQFATRRMQHRPDGPARVGGANHASLTRVVVTSKGSSLADYGAGD